MAPNSNINKYETRIKNIYTILAVLAGLLTFAVGIAGLASRLFGPSFAAAARQHFSMAPAPAALFLVFGAALLIAVSRGAHPAALNAMRPVILLATLFPTLVLAQSAAGIDLGMGIFFPGGGRTFPPVPTDRIYLVTLAIFSLSGLSALPLFFKRISKIQIKYAALALSSLPFTAGALMAVSSWQETPLVFYGSTMPLDLPTGLGFLTLGLALHALSALHILIKTEHEGESHAERGDLPAIISLSTGISLAVVLFAIVHRLEFKAIQDKFNLDTQNYAVALSKGIEDDMNEMRDLEGFFVSSPRVTRASFRSYANNILSRHAGIYALQWIPRVAGSSRGMYEASARKDGFANFRFTVPDPQGGSMPAERRPEYFPVYFSEPYRETDLALGLDLGSLPERRASLDKARDTGAAVATGRIRLLGEKGDEFAFLAVQPVYRTGLPHYTLEDRRKNLTGFTCGVFYIGDLAEAALKGINLEGIKITLVDDSAPPEEAALFSNLTQENSAGSLLYFFTTLNIADRQWTVEFYPTDRYLSSHVTPYSWTILAGGLAFTILLTLYGFKKERHAAQIERSNQIIATVLNSINAAIAIVDVTDLKILACNRVFNREAGFPESDVAGRRWQEIMQKPEPLPTGTGADPVMAEAMRSGNHAVRERVQTAAGEERHVEVSAYPVKDEAGNIVQLVHVSYDITERKQAERARLQEQEMQRMSAEREAVEARLRMLQAQIEPHFLFNTLANIISLVENEPESAKAMLQHFTTYLRLSLERSRKETSTLAHEAEMLRDYLSIFKMRMGRRLEFGIDIPPDLLELPFPPMLLQPLVENAIIHGLEPKIEGGSITVTAERRDSFLRIVIADTGLGFSELVSGSGIGLENVKARLQALYPGRAHLILEENIPCGVNATVEVPL